MEFPVFKLAFVIFSVLACRTGADVGQSGTSQVYFSLSESWPFTVCIAHDVQTCNIPAQAYGWTIHGLWITNMSAPWSARCSPPPVPFRLPDLKDLKSQLEVAWPDLVHSDTPQFWAHEWKKHAGCAFDFRIPQLMGVYTFFNQALRLYRSFNVSRALAESKITPSKNRTYDLEEIKIVLKNVYGKRPAVSTYKYKADKSMYLKQVRLCYDTQFLPMDCPMDPAHGQSDVSLRTHGQSDVSLSKSEMVNCLGQEVGVVRMASEYGQPPCSTRVWYKPSR